MSRIGRAPVSIPSGVKVSLQGQHVHVEGPKGKLSIVVPDSLKVRLDQQQLHVEIAADAAGLKPMHGLFRALINNMVQGVVAGFSRELEIVGVGYRAQMQGKQLSLSVGLSHPVLVDIPQGITVELPKPTMIVVKGFDKQLVGQFAANLRRVAPPEPYKGKGIKYANETIRRKAGKAATGAGSKATG